MTPFPKSGNHRLIHIKLRIESDPSLLRRFVTMRLPTEKRRSTDVLDAGMLIISNAMRESDGYATPSSVSHASIGSVCRLAHARWKYSYDLSVPAKINVFAWAADAEGTKTSSSDSSASTGLVQAPAVDCALSFGYRIKYWWCTFSIL